MLPPSRRTSSKSAGTTGTATPTSSPYCIFYGSNWASCISTHPFQISSVASSPSSIASARFALPPQKPAAVKAVRDESASLVQAQLPCVSLRSHHSELERAVSAKETHRLPTNARLPEGTCHVATLWCLCPSTAYTVSLAPLLTKESPASALLSGATTLTFHTSAFNAPLDLRDESPHLIEQGALLFHPEFVRCITAQGASKLLFYLPPKLLDARTALPFMHTFWYHGLFTLPESAPYSPHETLLFFLLPNGDDRFVLDLCAATLTHPAPLASPPQPSCGIDEEQVAMRGSERLLRLFPWRGQSKVRRVMRSGAYTVVVRDDAAGVMASLQRAYDYHVAHHKGTWLDPVFIRLMGSCCGSNTSVLPGDTCRARLVCVELVDEAAAEVVAGCCGMAIGSVYHDYTMYTLRRCKDSLGNLLTKLLGEALQRCGYTLWYWGYRVDYMADYERHFGAVSMPRGDFYRRWCAGRDVDPVCALEAFLRDGNGMVPHTSKTV